MQLPSNKLARHKQTVPLPREQVVPLAALHSVSQISPEHAIPQNQWLCFAVLTGPILHATSYRYIILSYNHFSGKMATGSLKPRRAADSTRTETTVTQAASTSNNRQELRRHSEKRKCKIPKYDTPNLSSFKNIAEGRDHTTHRWAARTSFRASNSISELTRTDRAILEQPSEDQGPRTECRDRRREA